MLLQRLSLSFADVVSCLRDADFYGSPVILSDKHLFKKSKNIWRKSKIVYNYL